MKLYWYKDLKLLKAIVFMAVTMMISSEILSLMVLSCFQYVKLFNKITRPLIKINVAKVLEILVLLSISCFKVSNIVDEMKVVKSFRSAFSPTSSLHSKKRQ